MGLTRKEGMWKMISRVNGNNDKLSMAVRHYCIRPGGKMICGGRLFKPHNSLRKIGTVIFISTLQTKKLRLRDVRQRVEGHRGGAEPNVRRNQGWEGSIIGEWIGPGERLVSCCGYSFLCLRGTWHVSSSITSTSVVSAG